MEKKSRTFVNIHVCGGECPFTPPPTAASTTNLSEGFFFWGGGTAPVRSSLDKGDLPTFVLQSVRSPFRRLCRKGLALGVFPAFVLFFRFLKEHK